MLENSKGPFGYINGQYDNLYNLNISVMDRGFIYGDGVYEVIPVYKKKPFLFQEHIQRLFDNLQKIALPCIESKNEIVDILYKLLDLTQEDNEYIYIQVTRGTYPQREHIYPNKIKSTVFAYTMPFNPPEFENQKKGISAIISRDIRWDRCDIKSISLLGNVLLRQEAHNQNAQEILLYRNDILTEGAVSNVFIVKNGIIKTPKLSNFILPGITRFKVIEVAKECNITCEECDIRINEVKEADEIWVTSSTKEVMPVTKLEGKEVTSNIEDSVWAVIFKAFQKHR